MQGSTRLGIVLLACALPLASSAETLRYVYRFDASRVVVEGPPGARHLEVAGMQRTWEHGRPEIPFDVVTFVVPRGSRLAALRATRLGERTLHPAVTLADAEARIDVDGNVVAPRPERLAHGVEAIGSRDRYPGRDAEESGSGALHGYQLMSVRVYPVQFDAGTGSLRACERLDLELDLVPGGALPLERERHSAAIEARARRTLERLVVNPGALDTYDRRLGVHVEKPAGGFQPSQAPSLEGSDVDYVLITTEALAPTYQTLVDWKTRRGVAAVLRTLEWIEANTRHGSDRQETVRNFIRDAYTRWGAQYVVLAGDTDLLPARYGSSNFGADKSIPTDLYFAALDGNWNLDGDALWGEGAVSGIDPGDSTDLYAEVFVGRIPFSTTAKAAAFVTKLLAYENPTVTDHQDEVVFLGEVLVPVNWDTTQSITTDGGDLCQQLVAETLPCATLTRRYENYANFPGALPLTLASTQAVLSAGPGIVAHVGHGYRYNMSVGDQSFQNNHALALTNTSRRFVLSMLNCTATAFDFPCLAEAMLESNGGAVGVLGASRSAFILPSQDYNRDFFRALYTWGYQNLGELFVQSRLARTPDAWFDTAHHYSHFLYNFLGDPEMILHRCALGTTAATHPSILNPGLSNVAVTVTVGGVPRAGARVCLQKGTEAYEFGTTDGAGSVTLPLRLESAGLVQVTVSGQDMTTYLGTIGVVTGGAAYVHVQNLALDDDATGASSGNGDGVLDAGETLELDLTLQNSGGAAVSTPTGKFRIPSPGVTVLDSTYSVTGSIAAGSTQTLVAPVHFSVTPATPDGTVLPLTFVTTKGASTWTDVLLRVVHAPAMQLVRLDVDDFAPGGNGNGVIEEGETFDLLAWFKNFGSGRAGGLQATLSSSDPDITIVNGAVTVGTAAPFQELTGATRFRLTESFLDENLLTLQLVDNYGRTLSKNITLRGPLAPSGLELDASTGPSIVVSTWSPSLESDLAGYFVYRSLALGGPWTRTSVDRTGRVAYFRDTELQPATLYYYYVTAVDASANESPPSLVASVNTNPAQLAGWPINQEGSSSCPPAVGDITGDGSKEIVSGNEHLYAWHADGIELLDDDGDPQTWGVFVNEILTVTGAVALGEIDASRPGFEVFALSWNDNTRAFAVAGDGDILPGWPQDPAPASVQKGYWANAAAVDVDADGLAELFAPAKNGTLYVWHGDGTPLGATAAFKSGLGTFSRSAPSFANLDEDPEREIVYGAPNGTLYIWNRDGSNLGGFPKTPGTLVLSNTAIGDVNRDGSPDVVLITEGGAVNVFDTRTGNQLPGWPRGIVSNSNPKSPSPALADFDFDGFLDIVVATNSGATSGIRVFDHLGNTRAGWPKTTGATTSESSPIVADVSGDGVPDILFGNEGGLLYGWDASGTALPGFPLVVGDFIRSVPFADDVDGDGSIDVVLAGWDKNLYIWDFPAPYVAAAAQWPTLSHDAQRSGHYGFRSQPTDAGDHEPATAPPPRSARLDQNHPNPFNPVTSIAYVVPGEGAAARVEARVDVFDTRGRRVRQLVRGLHVPGEHRTLWDGRDDHGRRVRSGVYFYRLQAAGEALTRKMVLLH